MKVCRGRACVFLACVVCRDSFALEWGGITIDLVVTV